MIIAILYLLTGWSLINLNPYHVASVFFSAREDEITKELSDEQLLRLIHIVLITLWPLVIINYLKS